MAATRKWYIEQRTNTIEIGFAYARAPGDIDAETRDLLAKLNDDLDQITEGDSASAGDRAKDLESRFAAKHPVAERITREIADILTKMGI